MLLSICIPNYNRFECLNNCLNSILISSKNSNMKFEVCISDNHSFSDINKIVAPYKNILDINLGINETNIGHGRNFLKVVSMAKGEYVWTLGNDDLILPKSLKVIEKILNNNKEIDFFFINSFNLDSKKIFSFPQPFNTNNLPKNMIRYSNIASSRKLKFFDLINPDISFDYLMGMYLLLFKKKKWEQNLGTIDEKKICDPRVFSTFDNTCGYVKIISKAFCNSNAYLQAEPLSVNLKGEREWGYMYDFVEIIRIPEVLDVHRKNGLPLLRFLYYKNNSLKNFLPNFIKMYLNKNKSGFNYVNFKFHFLKKLLYPNSFLSLFYFLLRKIKKINAKFI